MSYNTFSLPETGCVCCWAVRESQGFVKPYGWVAGVMCRSCDHVVKTAEFMDSDVYKQWLATVPLGTTIEESQAWIEANPMPPHPIFVEEEVFVLPSESTLPSGSPYSSYSIPPSEPSEPIVPFFEHVGPFNPNDPVLSTESDYS